MVKYFRSNERFEIHDFLDNSIGNYTPYDTNLNIPDLKEKIRALPSKPRSPFDNQFNIIKEKVKARFLNKVKLTPEIDLHIKGYFADNTIFATEENDGAKYVKIKSEEGYKYFKNLEQVNNQ
ncbi:hypothetical protein DSL64_27375 [Dyadobacter luteus]|uniref:Uncharacterized protein n=1 Tax=Dyadobacter luteus TaxID=2259619 RepID=A0A3D8Y2Y1_9BACT|nr:hypothetical protein [Dyadobacter luteus]REA56145.1 hypothetical protein DSL64_27375 [Dyadobacter luteus]